MRSEARFRTAAVRYVSVCSGRGPGDARTARTASVWYLTCWFAEFRQYPGCLFFNLTRAARDSGGIWTTAPEDAPQVYSVIEAEHTDDFSGGTVCRWPGTYGGGQDEPDVLAAAV